jgi:hypothetical protein
MTPRERADGIIRGTRALADAKLRVAYVRDLLRSVPVPELARALDLVCSDAEQAQPAAREVLVAVVDALQDASLDAVVQELREEAAGESLLALGRLIRAPVSTRVIEPGDPNEAPVPDYGRGRPLTLGERKAMARRPDRDMLERLLLDPHPDVIRHLLQSPRITEEDVIRLASKRPCRPDVLREIARNPKWMHRARIRMALILNPDTPPDVASTIAGLLVRQELKLVVESTRVPSGVRALCLEHLERRPPGDHPEEGELH